MPTPTALRGFATRALLALAFCACTPRAQAVPEPSTGSEGVRPDSIPVLPRSLPGYAVRDTFVFEEPNSGVSYRYRRDDGFQADVYLYPLEPQGRLCRGRCNQDAAEAVVASFKDVYPILIERGHVDSMVTQAETVVPVPRGSWLHPGRHLTFRLVRNGEPLQSHLYILVGREAVLKVRVSYPPGDFPAATVDSFVTMLLPAVPPPYTCRLGDSEEPGVMIATTQSRPAEEIVAALDAVLATPPYVLDFRAPEFGVWRTAPRFDQPDPESRLGASPGTVLIARVTSEGDSATAVITAQDACRLRPAGREKPPGAVAGMFLALQVMAALDSALKAGE